MHKVKIFLFFILFSILSFGQNLSTNKTGSFTYTPESPLNNKSIRVFYHIPNGDITTMPIVFSFHGASRNAEDYRDYWINMANANQFMVFAPEFSSADFPGGDAYNLANIFDDGDNPSSGSFNAKNEWTFSVIDPIFETIKTDISGTQEKYNAWGHSAGSQFLQRFVLYMPDSKLDIAVCANAGWYTVPENTVDFPYGINKGQLPVSDLENAFSKKVFIQLGTNDNNPNAGGLRRNTVVDNQQGIHRFERGNYFFNTSKTTAENLNTTFNWQKVEVPNVAHNGQQMANNALQYVLMSTLSNENFTLSNQIGIYPNPTTHYLYLNNLKPTSVVKIYTIHGVLLKSLVVKNRLNVSELAKGTYFLKIDNTMITFVKS